MRFSTMIRLFFILYCFEAGLFLLFAPWFQEWDRIMMQIVRLQGLRGVLLHPWFRGALTGFGMVHLVWGAHDLISLFTRRPPQDVPIAGDQ